MTLKTLVEVSWGCPSYAMKDRACYRSLSSGTPPEDCRRGDHWAWGEAMDQPAHGTLGYMDHLSDNWYVFSYVWLFSAFVLAVFLLLFKMKKGWKVCRRQRIRWSQLIGTILWAPWPDTLMKAVFLHPLTAGLEITYWESNRVIPSDYSHHTLQSRKKFWDKQKWLIVQCESCKLNWQCCHFLKQESFTN
jgi:hypothetical protein